MSETPSRLKNRPGSPKDRLIYALDYPSCDEALNAVKMLRDRVGLFKVGLELFARGGPDLVRRAADRAGHPVFLDLKLHDIPRTVAAAASAIRDLPVKFFTAHTGDGGPILEAAVSGAGPGLGVLAVTVLTSVENSDGPDKVAAIVRRRARVAAQAGCAGVVCSGSEIQAVREVAGDALLIVVPGIRLKTDPIASDDQRRTVAPAEAIRLGADYLVVGRPIRSAPDPRKAADLVIAEISQGLKEESNR